jgi:hypothetical protein
MLKKSLWLALLMVLTSGISSAQKPEPTWDRPDPDNHFSVEYEIAFGLQYHQTFEQTHQTKFVDYPQAQAKLLRFVNQTLLVAPDFAHSYPYKVFIFQGSRCDMESSAGGFIYVSSACLSFFSSEDLPTFYLAHEVKHIATKDQTTLYLLGEKLKAQGVSAAETSRQVAELRRKQETAAWVTAMRVVLASGYSPAKILGWMQMQAQPQERIDRLAAEVEAWKLPHPNWHDPGKWTPFIWRKI